MRRTILVNTMVTAISLLTGIGLVVDDSGTLAETVIQLLIPAVAIAYKISDKNDNYWPDFLEKEKADEPTPTEET
jgi:hypothetical protein